MEERKFNTGYIPSPPDERDYPIARILKTEKPIAKKVQLPKTPIKLDQGSTPKCVGSSLVNIYNAYHNAIGTLPKGGFSDDYAYERCKQLDGIPNTDGTFPRIALSIALHEGICTKEVWDKYKKVCPETMEDAKQYKIKAYARLNSLDEFKQAISNGKYLMFGSIVTDDWTKSPTKDDGFLGYPPNGFYLGGHATVGYGYNDFLKKIQTGHILGENSWGEGWGNGGSYQMPYDLATYKSDIGMPMLQEVWAIEFEQEVKPMDELKIEMMIGNPNVIVNGQIKKLDTEPVIHKDRTLVPLRFISEELGLQVKYDDKTRKITLTRGV